MKFIIMRKYLPILLILITSISIHAQEYGIKVKKVSFSSGFELDAVYGLGEDYFVQSIRGDFSPGLENLHNFEKSLNEMFCENANIRLGVSLVTSKLKNTELAVAFYKIDERYDAVEYTFEDVGNTFESLMYASNSDEVGFEAALIRALPIFNFFELHAGIGTQLGYSYQSDLLVSHAKHTFEEVTGDASQSSFQRNDRVVEIVESSTLMEETYSMKNSWSKKAFFQTGFGLIFLNRVEVGLMARYGFGHRFLAGKDYPTKLTSYNFTMAYRLI